MGILESLGLKNIRVAFRVRSGVTCTTGILLVGLGVGVFFVGFLLVLWFMEKSKLKNSVRVGQLK